MRDVSGNTALSYARAESIEERVRNLRVQRGGAKEVAKSEIVEIVFDMSFIFQRKRLTQLSSYECNLDSPIKFAICIK